jgi:hypothetical protein
MSPNAEEHSDIGIAPPRRRPPRTPGYPAFEQILRPIRGRPAIPRRCLCGPPPRYHAGGQYHGNHPRFGRFQYTVASTRMHAFSGGLTRCLCALPGRLCGSSADGGTRVGSHRACPRPRSGNRRSPGCARTDESRFQMPTDRAPCATSSEASRKSPTVCRCFSIMESLSMQRAGTPTRRARSIVQPRRSALTPDCDDAWLGAFHPIVRGGSPETRTGTALGLASRMVRCIGGTQPLGRMNSWNGA